MDHSYSYEAKEKMVKTAEDYVAVVDRQEGVYLLSLFPKADYDVFIHTVSSVLSELVELDIGFPGNYWPIPSGICNTSSRPVQTPPRDELLPQRRGRSMDRRIIPSPVKENISPTLRTPQPRPSSRSRILNRSIFKSPAVSPTKKSDRSPTRTAPLKASIKNVSSFFGSSKPQSLREDEMPIKNFDFNICSSLSDFILRSSELKEVEGLFRKPGSASRITALHIQLYDFFESEANLSRTLENPQGPHEFSVEDSRGHIDEMLVGVPPHDITGLLIRSVSALHSNEGLLPCEITDLLLKATRLQYALKDKGRVHCTQGNTDWPHRLCHARQLLAYRIILQFLLPKPERVIFFGILSALHEISLKSDKNLMTSTALARCLSNTILGTPVEPELMNQYIDTLINLIELSDDLEGLPQYLYLKIKEVLDGDSDICGNMKLLKRKHNTGLDNVMKKRSWVTTAQISLDSPMPKVTAPPPILSESNMSPCTPVRRAQTPLVGNNWISTPSGTFLRADPNLKLTGYTTRDRSPFKRWPKKKQQQQQPQQALSPSLSPKVPLVKSKSFSRSFMDNVRTVGSKFPGL